MSARAEKVGGVDESRMTLVEHLIELRSRLIKAILAILVGCILAFFLWQPLLDFLLAPLCDAAPENCTLIITDPVQGLSTRLKVSGYAGIFFAMPVILWQLWRFITPGLYDHERKLAIPFVLSSLALFLLGSGLAYWTLPKALGFLIDVGGPDIQPFFTPTGYIGLVTYMMLAFGIGFEFPIVLIFLQLAGVLTADRLKSWRRYAIVGIVALVAVITPSGDPWSLLALSVPMYLFYEAAILIGRLLKKRMRTRETA